MATDSIVASRKRVLKASCLVTLLAAIATGCQVTSSTSTAARTGVKFDGGIEAAKIEDQASRFSSPERRATKFLDAAEAYLAASRPYDAKRCVNSARQAYYAGSVAARANQILGAAYIESGEVALAERYLLKSVDALHGEERDLAYARLSICAEARKDRRAQKSYERRIASPNTPQVMAVLARRLEANIPGANSSRIEALRARQQREQATRAARAARSARTPSQLRLTKVSPLTRSAWSARPPVSGRLNPMTRIHRITIHHTAGNSFWAHSRAEVARHIRSIQNTHQTERKWADVGYHWFIDRTGTVWQGRSLRYQGAHVSQNNPGNIGIALLGNYERQKVTPAQTRALQSLVIDLATRYRVQAGEIRTHGEVSANHTACPGRAITSLVSAIRTDLKRGYLALGK